MVLSEIDEIENYLPKFQVLAMRSAINDRIFQIRKEEITICKEQGIQQEDYLDDFRYCQQ